MTSYRDRLNAGVYDPEVPADKSTAASTKAAKQRVKKSTTTAKKSKN